MSAHWRVRAGTLWLALTAAIVWPVVDDEDGFPLSNYPMFSRPKGTSAKLYHVVGFSADGARAPMPPEVVGTDEIMQAHQTVKLGIRGNRGGILCDEAARRLEASGDFPSVVRLEVRIDVYDAVRYWEGDRSTDGTRIVAKCEVAR